ncbi:MAG: hypothetical protein LUC43_04480 [Burkholderiales bacterium]|nr:hypothetical protein [Burkholderiales bacterium]
MGRRTSIGRTKQNNSSYRLSGPPQDILDLYKRNPQRKKRGQDLIKALATRVKNHTLVIWFVGTRGAGWSDIEKGYEGISDTKQKAIEEHVVFESKSASIMPRNRYEMQSFYSNLANLLRNITTDGERPDLICFCRGGGGQEDLYRLNNEELCRSIIECPIPVCAAVGHSTDKSLWIKQIADFATDTPSKFLMFLFEVLEQAGFLFHQESSGSQPKSYVQPEQPKLKSELPATTVSTPVYGNYNSNPRVIPPPTFSEGQTGSTGSDSEIPTSSDLYFSGKPRNSHPNIEKDSWGGFDSSSARKIAELTSIFHTSN